MPSLEFLPWHAMSESPIWKPNVTVAAVIEKDGRFLLVEENTTDGRRFNQPAGHLECREALVDAVHEGALRGDKAVVTSIAPGAHVVRSRPPATPI